jgi:DNA-binding NtrC family response regulator
VSKNSTPIPAALVGSSVAARTASAAFRSALARRAPVLIDAEPGYRLREVAAAFHAHSRPAEAFVLVDCGADDPLAIEQRLFGEVASAASSRDLESATERAAILEAGAGTVFLDQAEELPAAAQRRLARVLRDGEVRVARGSRRTAFRLVAASTRDLDSEVREGRFRDDLLRRLVSCRISIAPLRRRAADIPEILAALAERPNGVGARRLTLDAQALTVLTSMPWRNLDELCEFVEALGTTDAVELSAQHVLAQVSLRGQLGRVDLTASLREARRQFEKNYIAAVLERHRWSMSEAARTLGIERANLYRKTRQLGISRGSRDRWTVQS